MRVAGNSLALLLMGMAAAACSDAPGDAPVNNSALVDIEALPPDESVEMPANDLADDGNQTTDSNASQY